MSSNDGSDLKLIVKNTFLHVADKIPPHRMMSRSCSETDIDSISGSTSFTGSFASLHSKDAPLRGTKFGDADDSSSVVSRESGWNSENPLQEATRVQAPVSQTPTRDATPPALETHIQAQDIEDGSKWRLHETGKCKPCVYWKSSRGCVGGANCTFCHFDGHERKNRPRPSKYKRIQCKQMIALVNVAFESNPDALALATDRLCSKSDYMRSILQHQRQSQPSDSSRSNASSASRSSYSQWSSEMSSPMGAYKPNLVDL